MVISMRFQGRSLLGILRDRIPNAFDFLRCLLPGNTHHLHEFHGHFRRDLILNAAVSVRVGLEKHHDFFLSHTRPLQSVEKLPIANLPSQLLDARHELLTVRAHARPETDTISTISATTHKISVSQLARRVRFSPPSLSTTNPVVPGPIGCWRQRHPDA